jgi:hypothetical protein
MPIQDVNTSAPIYKEDEALKKLAALHLFVETSPFNKAVTSGKGNRLFTAYLHFQIANNP